MSSSFCSDERSSWSARVQVRGLVPPPPAACVPLRELEEAEAEAPVSVPLGNTSMPREVEEEEEDAAVCDECAREEAAVGGREEGCDRRC